MAYTKLYPPIIEGVLPAFYLEYDASTGTILKGGSLTVPFAMNTTVGESLIKGFSLRLRTTSSGTYVLPPLYSNSYSLSKGTVTFSFTPKQAALLKEGQYYKVQIAYCGSVLVDEAGNRAGTDIGYYSTVGVTKCTSKPNISIRGLTYENINAFNNEMFGLYDLTLCKDLTEKVYSYEFKVYDEADNIFYTTGELLHQSYYDTEYTSSIDRVVLNDFASTDTIYSIEYNVTTINGLELSSPKYRISSLYLVSPNAKIEILPLSNEVEGTITVYFKGDTDPEHSYYYLIDLEKLNDFELDENGEPIKDSASKTLLARAVDGILGTTPNKRLAFLKNNSIYKHNLGDGYLWYYAFRPNHLTGFVKYNGVYYPEEYASVLDTLDTTYIESYTPIIAGKDLMKQMTYKYVDDNYVNLAEEVVIGNTEQERKYYGNYLLSRASDADNYTTWFNIARFKLDNELPSTFSIKDITVEHGRKYKYALLQYNIWGLYSARIVSDIFEASFEDAFLFDADKILRIRYNPEISSFKTTILEQKTDTIGSRFPFITRNGATYYKEFPLGGLLAQEIDEPGYFADAEKVEGHRHATSDDDSVMPKNTYRDYHTYSDENIGLERNFKLNVLDWLNNGKPKLFKSPYEGNYIVRLMNVSLTPVNELGRLLHSFSSTAYEIAECTYENLVSYGFIDTSIPSDLVSLWRSYDLNDDSLRAPNGDIIISLDHGILNFTIQDMMPGDIIYLTFAEEPEELPIMIGITGSYTYENIKNTLVKIRIPTVNVDHRITGIVNVFYDGMRITDFDSIIGMQLKTILSLQYIGVSPWMESVKTFPWGKYMDNYGNYSYSMSDSQYKELQNYNFRTYLDSLVTRTSSSLGGQIKVNYAINDNFIKTITSFDPNNLLDRINLSINKDEKYKTELVKLEMLRFRQRPLIPVYTALQNHDILIGQHKNIFEEEDNPKLLVSTSPFGYPYPIEQLSQYELIDPFCIYEVFKYSVPDLEWIPIDNLPYYDPYYRAWLNGPYDPRVKMNYRWIEVAQLSYNENGELDAAGQSFYDKNQVNQANKIKKENHEFIELAINEQEMYDYELFSYTDTTGNVHYYYTIGNTTYEIEDNKLDIYTKSGDKYYAINLNTINSNTSYWIKHYDVVLNLATERMVLYNNIAIPNACHMGNGVIAEITFLLRIVDYYTEIYDEDVRAAKEEYLEAKNFYTNLMKLYNTIAQAHLDMLINYAFRELYYRMLNGIRRPLDDRDKAIVENVLAHAGTKEELKLLSLYWVYMINTEYDADAMQLLLKYKNNYAESEWLTALLNAEVYYYYAVTTNRIIDEYYVMDERYFDDSELPLYIKDNSSIGSNPEQEDILTYRYKHEDGQVYYYKVNKSLITQDDRVKNQEEKPENLAVKYNPSDGTFNVETIENINAEGSEIYLLERQSLNTINSYLAILNKDEVASLKLNSYYLFIEPASTETTSSNSFDEEKEIRDVLSDKQDFLGVADKYSSMQSEIGKIESNISDLQTLMNNAINNYMSVYLNLGEEIRSYNNDLYRILAAALLYNVFNTASADKYEDTLALYKAIAKEALAIDTEAVLEESEDKAAALIYAVNLLCESINGDLPTVKTYQKMINDLSGDNAIDEYLLKLIQEKYGVLVLQALALSEAMKLLFTMMQHSLLNDTLAKEVVEDCLIKYNNVKKQVANENTGRIIESTFLKINEENVLQLLVDSYYLRYIDLWTNEGLNLNSSNEINIENFALLSNYYDDIQFLINNARTTNTPIEDDKNNKYIPISITSTQKPRLSNNIINPLDLSANDNIFAESVSALSDSQKTSLLELKNLTTYFYRTRLPFSATSESGKNVIKLFIFNPLSDEKKDNNIGSSYDNNKAAFDAYSNFDKNNIMEIYMGLMLAMSDILRNLPSTKTQRTTALNRLLGIYTGTDISTRRATIIENMRSSIGLFTLVKNAITWLSNHDIATSEAVLGFPAVTIASVQTSANNPVFLTANTKTRNVYYIPYRNNDNTINLNTNLVLPIFLKENLLEYSTIVDEEDSSVAALADTGVYRQYLNERFASEIEELTNLLNQALVLYRLYEKEYGVYTNKYDEYAQEYELNLQLYNSYYGTDAYEFYNLLNNEDLTEKQKLQYIADRKRKVQEAWWAFLNLLDARYSAEKERGMYI